MAASEPQTRLVRPDAANRRTRLREYQLQLLERMQAARNNSNPRINQLGVSIGAERYLLDLTQAGEIVSVPALVVVPLTRSWYMGLANIRGNLVGVVDLAPYLEQPATPIRSESRVITFAGGLGFNCALLVGRVYGLRNAAEMAPAGERLRDPEGNEWQVLDLAALVQEPAFLHVGL